MNLVRNDQKFTQFARAIIVAGFLFALLPLARAFVPLPGGSGSGPVYYPLDSWSFYDPTNWTSNHGYAPVSFTNLAYSNLGDGASLIVDTNLPAWLQFNVAETDGTTNLTVDSGTVTFWFAPNWSSTNDPGGGLGPQVWGRLLEVGGYTSDSSFGWWSIYLDAAGANIYFSAQTNDLSSSVTTYLTAPIDWTTNYFHFVAVTYSPTNTALYLDGALATNGPPLTVYPGPDVLANGFFIGSDSNGVLQAHGLFDSVATYNVPLDAGTIGQVFSEEHGLYMIDPLNAVMFGLVSAPSSPANTPTFDVISGQGDLQWAGSASTCSYGTTAYDVWITNVMATVSGTGTNDMSLTFTIEGGADGFPYDVFANSVLSLGPNGVPWVWMGQGYHCNTYTLTNLPDTTCFLILGTPLDTSGFGLTDAYESLVEKINPDGVQTDGYGVPYAWYVQNGLGITSATQDPDQDGLLNYQEYFYGTKPTVSEGFTVWVGTPSGTISIP